MRSPSSLLARASSWIIFSGISVRWVLAKRSRSTSSLPETLVCVPDAVPLQEHEGLARVPDFEVDIVGVKKRLRLLGRARPVHIKDGFRGLTRAHPRTSHGIRADRGPASLPSSGKRRAFNGGQPFGTLCAGSARLCWEPYPDLGLAGRRASRQGWRSVHLGGVLPSARLKAVRPELCS